ncbi:hypothetical protein D3C85_1821290 [compost metagenome]
MTRQHDVGVVALRHHPLAVAFADGRQAEEEDEHDRQRREPREDAKVQLVSVHTGVRSFLK